MSPCPEEIHGGFAVGGSDLVDVDSEQARASNNSGFVGVKAMEMPCLAIGSPVKAIEPQRGTQQDCCY